MAGKKKTGNLVLRLIGVLVSVILLALLAAALILAKPQEDKPDAPAEPGNRDRASAKNRSRWSLLVPY